MPFITECLYCAHRIRVTDNSLGQSAECPKCHNCFTVAPAAGPADTSAQAPFFKRTRKPRPRPRADTPAPREQGPVPVDYRHTPLSRGASLPAESDEEQVPASVPADFPEDLTERPWWRQFHPLGVVSLFLGSLGLVCASLSGLSFLTLPLAGLGLALGAVALFLCLESTLWKLLAPVLGALVSLVVLALALFWPYLFNGNLRGGQGVDPNKDQVLVVPLEGVKTDKESLTVSKGPPASPAGAQWVDASRAGVQVNDLRVQVITAEVAPLEVRVKDTRSRTGKKFLIIRLRVTNVGAGRVVLFKGWSAACLPGQLTDDQGTSYSPAAPEGGKEVVGQVNQPTEVFWGGEERGGRPGLPAPGPGRPVPIPGTSRGGM